MKTVLENGTTCEHKMNFLLQFPTIFRPSEFKECLELYLKTCSQKNFLHFNIVCDEADETMNNENMKDYVRDFFFGNTYCSYSLHFDKDTSKISAINAHIDDIIENYDIVYCLSDDMIPQVDEWDEIIANCMRENFPSLDGCIHINTGEREAWKDLITLSILGKNLYKEFGYIYHPDYKSFYCDDEFTTIMKSKDKIYYIDDIIIRHEHHEHSHNPECNRNAGNIDKSVNMNMLNWGRDGSVFSKRKQQGFPKQRITND